VPRRRRGSAPKPFGVCVDLGDAVSEGRERPISAARGSNRRNAMNFVSRLVGRNARVSWRLRWPRSRELVGRRLFFRVGARERLFHEFFSASCGRLFVVVEIRAGTCGINSGGFVFLDGFGQLWDGKWPVGGRTAICRRAKS